MSSVEPASAHVRPSQILLVGVPPESDMHRILQSGGFSDLRDAPPDADVAALLGNGLPSLVILDLDLIAAAAQIAQALKRSSAVPPHVIGIGRAVDGRDALHVQGGDIDEYVARPFAADVLLTRVRSGLQLRALDVNRHDRLNELLVLEELGRLLGSESTLESVLAAVARQLVKLSMVDFAGIVLEGLDRTPWAVRGLPERDHGDALVRHHERAGAPPSAELDLRVLARNRGRAVPLAASGVAVHPVETLPMTARALARQLGIDVVTRVPLAIGVRARGTLLIGRRGLELHSERQTARLRHVAGLIAGMVERRGLRDEIDAHVRRLARLQGLIRLMTTTFESEPIVKAVIDGAMELLGAGAARIWVRDLEGTALRLRASSEPIPPTTHLALQGSFAGRVLHAQRPFQTSRSRPVARPHAPIADFAVADGAPPLNSWLGVPILTDGAPTGVLAVLSRERRHFNEHDVEILSALGQSVGLALHTVHLYEDAARTDERLRDVASLTTMGMLTTGIVHEVAQPITAVVAMLEVLAQEERLSPNGRSLTTRMKRILLGIGGTATHLRRFARRTESTVQAVDLAQVLADALSLIEHEFRLASIDVKVDVDADVPSVWGNADALERVFVNLLTNARDAMDGRSGTVTISAYRSRPQTVPPSVAVQVQDQGIGIAANVREQMFQPLFTTKERTRGLGLGLSLVKRTVDQHGGSIHVESIEGEGATFRVLLPIDAPRTRGRRRGALDAHGTARSVGHG